VSCRLREYVEVRGVLGLIDAGLQDRDKLLLVVFDDSAFKVARIIDELPRPVLDIP